MTDINKALGRKTRSENNKAEQANLVRIIGQRMREAREMTNLSQLEAAEKLGYKTSAKLSKIEGATEGSVPLLTIIKAASLYEVSTDYLIGVVEDWEVDKNHTIDNEKSAWVLEAWEMQRRRDIETMMWLKHRVDAIDQSIPEVHKALIRFQSAFDSFTELNPYLEDMKGAIQFTIAIKQVSDMVTASNNEHESYRRDTLRKAKDKQNLNLFA